MKLEPYMEFGGIEIANSLRTLSYLRMGLGGAQWNVTTDDVVAEGVGYGDVYGDEYLPDPFENRNIACYCGTFDIGNFGGPAYDSAPWYDPARPESNEFLGLLPMITLLPAATRTMTRRSAGRGDLGPLVVGPRIIQVAGAIFAGSRAGMGYGERWLSWVLSGRYDACGGDSLTVLPYCTATDVDDGSDALRELLRVGITDGPTFSAPVVGATTRYQEVSFQLAAGEGWLRRTTSLYSGALGSGSTCRTLTAEKAASAAAVITITAGGGTLNNVEITAPAVSVTVLDLPSHASIVIDASLRTVTVRNIVGTDIGSLDHLDFTGLFPWLETPAGSTLAVCVDASSATGTSGATLAVDQVDLEL